MLPKNLIPDGLHYFIAGGWAACPALATDRDVFVQTAGDLIDTRAMLLDHMRAQGFEVVEEDETRDAVTINGYDNIPIVKVAKVTQKRAQPIHVLVTSGDIEEVLNTFDINTSQVAITDTGRIVKGDNYSSPVQPVCKVRDTPSTDARFSKYEARFARA